MPLVPPGIPGVMSVQRAGTQAYQAGRMLMNVWKPVDKLGAYALKYAPRLTTRVSLPLLRARKDTVPFTPFSKQFSESRAALVTTTGVHLRNQRPFDTASRAGDPTYREIPSSTPASELEIHHGHYDQADAEKDINVVFPIEIMRELAADGIIGSLAKTFYGFMGYVMKFEQLERKYSPEVAGKLLLDNVDLVILTPG